MDTTKTYYHYIDTNGTAKTEDAVSHHFSPGSEELNHEVCLVNTCFEHTEFEPVPVEVDKWLDEIGMDFTHFPNLTRLWGENRSEYAFTLRYELAHEHISKDNIDFPAILPYDEQLKLLKEAAAKIAKTIPYAIVRLSEMAACCNQHELEIAFLYPCEPLKVLDGCGILNKKFDYIWDIGREPRETPVKKYILISCVEREIGTPDSFDTYEEAYCKMSEELMEALDSPDDYTKGDDYDIDEYSAWANIRDNWDWKIFCMAIENSGRVTMTRDVQVKQD